MSYISTVDEKYGGIYSFASAGYRDAPSSTSTPYVLAAGYFNAAYGALFPSYYVADQDAYSLGLLAPGRYSVHVSGYNWDFGNSVYGGSINDLSVYDSANNLVVSSATGNASFVVYSTTTAIVNLVGSTYSGTEYELYYTYDGPLIVNYPASSGTLGIAGDLRVGSTVSATGSFSDANGTSNTLQYFQWFRSTDGAQWSTITAATSSSYTLATADQGYYVGYSISFIDDAGFSELVSAGSAAKVVNLDLIASTIATTSTLAGPTGSATGSIDSNGDTDWFGVNLVAGTTYVFNLSGSSTEHGTLVDPWLSLFGSSGAFLLSDDDGGLAGTDARLVYTPASTGKYFLSAEESGNNATGAYQISMATPALTALAANGQPVTAGLSAQGEEDWFQANLTEGVTYVFSLKGAATGDGTLLDPVLNLYASSGSLLWTSDDGGIGKNSLINFTPSSSGSYLLSVRAFDAGTGTYELQMLPNDSSPTAGQPLFSGNAYIDAATHGYAWNLGASRTLTWALSDSGTWSWNNPQQSADQIAAVLASVEAVANIHFEYAGYFSGALGLTNAGAAGADISIAFDAAFFTSTSVWGRSNFPSTAAAYNPYQYGAGDILLNPSSAANGLSYEPGSAGYFLILHELGHTLGLKHPHDDGGTAHPTFAQAGIPAALDDDWATVMSYQDDFNWNLTQWDPATPMVLDVMALQYLYGPNNLANTGDSTYYLTVNDRYQTIWDASGVDVVDASASVYGWNIFLSLGGEDLGLAQRADESVLSFPTTLYWLMGGIENITGSNQADQIHGNGMSNVLRGNGGDDAFEGGAGNDRMEGGAGNDTFDWIDQSDFVPAVRAGDDTMLGGPGDDIYVVSGADQVIELAGEGVDLIWADQSWSLMNNGFVENLSLYGSAAVNITGSNSAFGNVLIGNTASNVINGGDGNDSMVGGAGNDTFDPDSQLRAGYDTMVGGDGSDTYYVDSTADVVTETNAVLDLGGRDTVVAFLASYTVGANVEDLVLGSGATSGLGNALNNVLSGNAGNNLLQGLAGDDTLDGGSGDDTLRGGADIDTAAFNGVKAGYTVVRAVGGWTVTDTNSADGNDGIDTLDAIEKLSFSDQTVLLRQVSSDFDGDGRSDLLFRNTATGANTIWKSGNSATIQTVATETNQAWQMAGVGDFQGDGKSDILWRNSSTGQNYLYNSGNVATGGFLATQATAFRMAGIGDFDGDGKSDILWRNTSTGANTIWKSGDSVIVQTVATETNQAWQVAGVGDFQGDGRADILWRNSSTGQTYLYNSGNAATGGFLGTVADLNWKVVGIGDFDGDGKSDILWRNTSTGANTIWKSANIATPQAVATEANQAWQVAGVGDFQGDGKADILWRNSTTGQTYVYNSGNVATGGFLGTQADLNWKIQPITATTGSTITLDEPPPTPIASAFSDFDGDGKSDILWRNSATGADTIWKSSNSATMQAVATEANQAWQVAGIGDFQGDGKADILWRNSSTGQTYLYNSGNAATGGFLGTVADLNWRVVGIGDFDADGKSDILWRNTSTGANTIWKSGNSATMQNVATEANQAWQVAGVGDFQGDGKSDILWRNATTGQTYLYNSGNVATGGFLGTVTDLNWKVVGIGDFDADGKSDVLWRNTSTGANTIWKSGNSATLQAVATEANPAWQVVQVGDLQGDGRADIVWRNATTGQNYVYNSGNVATGGFLGTVADLNWNAIDGLETGDLLRGGSGVNTLVGTINSDVLFGAAGSDTMTGGKGADLFRYTSPSEGADSITDFTPGVDKIQLLGSAFGILGAGPLPAINFVSGTIATQAAPQFLYNTTNGVLTFDADGPGGTAPVNLVTLIGNPVLTLVDLVLVGA